MVQNVYNIYEKTHEQSKRKIFLRSCFYVSNFRYVSLFLMRFLCFFGLFFFCFCVFIWFIVSILYEIFLGEAGQVAANEAPESVKSAFSTMRWIVTIGWAIYPIGYFMGYFTGAGPEEASSMLNIIYNLADVVNKIAFGVIIWNVAVTESDKAKA